MLKLEPVEIQNFKDAFIIIKIGHIFKQSYYNGNRNNKL